ncbi:hypothetical protein ABVT39_002207 [Epinephelus coioides]
MIPVAQAREKHKNKTELMAGTNRQRIWSQNMSFCFFLMYFLIEEEERWLQRHRWLIYLPLRESRCETRPLYCRVNLAVPVLQNFFNPDDTRRDFRLSRESLEVLLDLLNQERQHGWGATIETLVFLFWLTSGASYRVVSRVFGIRHKVIYLPKTADDLVAVTRGFAGLARHRAFRKAAGAIGGCHVRIKPPSGPDGQCYKNRKLFASIIMQAVCDHQGSFIDMYVAWPGLVHDSRVLRHSPLYGRAIYPPPGYFILADGHTHHRACVWDDEDEVQGPLPPSAGGALHLCATGAGDIMAPEGEVLDDMSEDEGENGLEAVSGAPWQDQLSAEVSALEEGLVDHDYL